MDAVVALAFFIPLLIGTGGNVGSQIVTTIIRAMAVGEVAFQDIFRILGKELTVGVCPCAIMAVATYGRAWLLGVSPDIGITVALAATLVVLWTAIIAAMLPLTLRRFGVDPAVASAPLITTLVDGTGLFLYLTIARFMLSTS